MHLPKIQPQDLYQGKALKVSDCLLKEFPGIMLLSQYDYTKQTQFSIQCLQDDQSSQTLETQLLHTLSSRAYKLVE